MKKKPASLETLLAGETPVRHEGEVGQVVPLHRPDTTLVAETHDKMTIYVPKAAAKRIRQMALDHNRRANDFLQEGIDLMLQKYGQPSLSEFGKK